MSALHKQQIAPVADGSGDGHWPIRFEFVTNPIIGLVRLDLRALYSECPAQLMITDSVSLKGDGVVCGVERHGDINCLLQSHDRPPHGRGGKPVVAVERTESPVHNRSGPCGRRTFGQGWMFEGPIRERPPDAATCAILESALMREDQSQRPLGSEVSRRLVRTPRSSANRASSV